MKPSRGLRSNGEIVLVLADDLDTTADGVCTALVDRGVPFFRFDTADFPGRSELDVRLDLAADPRGGAAPWTGRLVGSLPRTKRPHDQYCPPHVDLDRIGAVYLRRPRPFEVPAHLSPPERWHAATECRYGLGGVLSSLPVPYVNHPSRSADAAYKLRQLTDLRSCGLRVPPTLITNSGSAVRAFADEYGTLICKALAATVLHAGSTSHIAYTRKVTAADLADLARPGSGIDYAAHLFQPFVPSTHAVRLIIIGDRTFSVRIDAHSDRARTDWRSDYDNLSYRTVVLPEDVLDGVHAYMRLAGLHYGAWDFLGHDDGTFTCLECNPEGNFAWLEDVVDARITAAIADFLVDQVERPSRTRGGSQRSAVRPAPAAVP